MWHPNWSIEASQSVRQRSSFFFHLLFRYLLHVPLPHNPGWLLKTHGNVLISECAERKGEGHSILRALLEPCLLLPLTFHLIECRPEKCCFILGSPVPRLKSQIGGECIVSSTMFQITLILALYCPAETQLTRNNQMVSKTDPSLRHGSTQ